MAAGSRTALNVCGSWSRICREQANALNTLGLAEGALRWICLTGPGAGNYRIFCFLPLPLTQLHLCSLQLSLDNFKLQPPVTFRLAAGSGPVHLAGWHRISKD